MYFHSTRINPSRLFSLFFIRDKGTVIYCMRRKSLAEWLKVPWNDLLLCTMQQELLAMGMGALTSLFLWDANTFPSLFFFFFFSQSLCRRRDSIRMCVCKPSDPITTSQTTICVRPQNRVFLGNPFYRSDIAQEHVATWFPVSSGNWKFENISSLAGNIQNNCCDRV